MSWWQVVPEVILLTVATIAWARELQRRKAKRARVIEQQNAKAKQSEHIPETIGAALGAMTPMLANIEHLLPAAYQSTRSWQALGLIPTALNQSTSGYLASNLLRGMAYPGLPSRLAELESQVADIEQRLDVVEGQVAGLAIESRNVASAPAKVRGALVNLFNPIPAS